mmetsp:Transcript_22222/g.32872  ORF Transcript_22222/g.32872 Transcript_22222/m.32872 type:complete len:86 (+) Transcript_22222:178-435(+)
MPLDAQNGSARWILIAYKYPLSAIHGEIDHFQGPFAETKLSPLVEHLISAAATPSRIVEVSGKKEILTSLSDELHLPLSANILQD